MSQRVMKLIDPSTGLMECQMCGTQHVASKIEGRARLNGQVYKRGSWQCLNGCTVEQLRAQKKLNAETIRRMFSIVVNHVCNSAEEKHDDCRNTTDVIFGLIRNMVDHGFPLYDVRVLIDQLVELVAGELGKDIETGETDEHPHEFLQDLSKRIAAMKYDPKAQAQKRETKKAA